MRKTRKSFVSVLMALIMLSVMSIDVHAEEEDYVYLEVTYPDGETMILDAARNREEANDEIIYIYTDDFPITLRLYSPGDWSEDYIADSYGRKHLEVRTHVEFFFYLETCRGYAMVEILPTSQKEDIDTLAAEEESEPDIEKDIEEERGITRYENFKKMLLNAGMTGSYNIDKYIKNDLEEFVNGQWDGDIKNYYAKMEYECSSISYISLRKYRITQYMTNSRGRMLSKESYECNIDYLGDLNYQEGEDYTLAFSKKDNIVYCWRFFECLEQWQLPKTEHIIDDNINNCYDESNDRYGLVWTRDADGNKHLYSLQSEGKVNKLN